MTVIALTAPAFLAHATSPLPCKTRPEIFHAPERRRPTAEETARRVAAAVDLCLDCPLMLACRDAGRQGHETGVWGGETDEERAAAGYPPETRILRETIRPGCGSEAGAKAHRRRDEGVCCRCLKAERAAHAEREKRRRAARLTCPPQPREVHILAAFAAGRDRDAIAKECGINRRSVNAALWRLRHYFSADTNEQLIAVATAKELLPQAAPDPHAADHRAALRPAA